MIPSAPPDPCREREQDDEQASGTTADHLPPRTSDNAGRIMPNTQALRQRNRPHRRKTQGNADPNWPPTGQLERELANHAGTSTPTRHPTLVCLPPVEPAHTSCIAETAGSMNTSNCRPACAPGTGRRHRDLPRRIAALLSRRGRTRRRRLRVRPSRHPGTALPRQRPPAQRPRAHRLDLGQRHRTRRPWPTIFQRPLRSTTETTPACLARCTLVGSRPGPLQATRPRVPDTGRFGVTHRARSITVTATNSRPAALTRRAGQAEPWQTSPHDP